MELRPKIVSILKIICEMDLSDPETEKEGSKIFWKQKKGKELPIFGATYQEKWFKQYFLPKTIEYVKERGNADFQRITAQEYITSQLNYFDEEVKRLKESIIKFKYIKEINEINYKYLFGERKKELIEKCTGNRLPEMFTNKRYDEVKKIFKLFLPFNEIIEIIANDFIQYIKKKKRKFLKTNRK